MLGNLSAQAVYEVGPPTGIKFSQVELQHIAISIIVLSLAFAIVFSGRTYDVAVFTLYFLVSLVAVVTGFAFHEFAHKILAQKYGCWAEFRMYPFGLLFALVTAFFGFVFAAPGAVMVSGYMTQEQNGRISVAGPLTNATVSGAFLAIAFAFVFVLPEWAWVPWFIAFINIFLAGFNLIPFPPFDGSKVISWSLPIWMMALVTVGALFAIVWFFWDILTLIGL